MSLVSTLCQLADIFFKIFFFQNQLFRKIISEIPSVLNSLDPGQARRSVGPGLDRNCLQRFSADNISVISMQRASNLCKLFKSNLYLVIPIYVHKETLRFA